LQIIHNELVRMHSGRVMLLVQWVDGGRGGGPPTADHAIILREIITGRYDNISITQKNNRKLLLDVMTKNGFSSYPKEWWHYTLIDEPFPTTYFDFIINK
jgi:hypothetical protein